MAQSNICIRLDEDLKKRFDSLCDELGLTMTSAINIFIRKVVNENRIPFEVSTNIPNHETRKAIEDIENGIGLSKQYKTSHDVIKAMLEENNEDEN